MDKASLTVKLALLFSDSDQNSSVIQYLYIDIQRAELSKLYEVYHQK